MEAIILSLALICRNESYTERSQKTWPATLIAEHFVHILEKMAQKNTREQLVRN